MRFTKLASARRSVGFMPAAGSSSARSLGSVASARDFEAALVAVRKIACRLIGAGADADILEKLDTAPLDVGFFPQGSFATQHGTQHARARSHVPPDHDVLQRR